MFSLIPQILCIYLGIWHILYSTSSSVDIGTLHQAQNFLNLRNVPKNRCVTLTLVRTFYCDALLIAAFDQITTEHYFNLSDRGDDTENKNFVNALSSNIVDRFILLEVPTSNNNLPYQCELGNKKFKKVKTLREHRKLNHKNKKKKSYRQNASDYVFNYSVNALALCYLAQNFIDTRKHGDGARIIRMYKYLLMYFKLDSRIKYSYQIYTYLPK